MNAFLVLDDGTIYHGHTCGIEQSCSGEIVFNTAMTGYQEICTDPSYAGQIVVFTAPHIGNVGTNREDWESDRAWVEGVIVREMSKTSSNWRSEQSFPDFLKEHGIPWIAGIDTRKLTRHLREKGPTQGCILISDNINSSKTIKPIQNVIHSPFQSSSSTKRVAVYDFGVKANILKMLANLGCHVEMIPSTKTVDEILSRQPHGVVISNGPGDPETMRHGIRETKRLIESRIPLLGICLGCQLIALALGGQTKKMNAGHHGTNHPVYDRINRRVYITSQNHYFAIDERSLPSHCTVTHHSLFDGTVQGIRLNDFPVFGFQGHPEGSPGPQDINGVILDFIHALR